MIFVIILAMILGVMSGFVGHVNDRYGGGGKSHRNHRGHHHRW